MRNKKIGKLATEIINYVYNNTLMWSTNMYKQKEDIIKILEQNNSDANNLPTLNIYKTISRYGEIRLLEKKGENLYIFKGNFDFIRCLGNDIVFPEAIDPDGGPYLSIGTDLSSIFSIEEIITRIVSLYGGLYIIKTKNNEK